MRVNQNLAHDFSINEWFTRKILTPRRRVQLKKKNFLVWKNKIHVIARWTPINDN